MSAFLPDSEGRRPGEAAQLPPHALPLDGVAGLPYGKLQGHEGTISLSVLYPRGLGPNQASERGTEISFQLNAQDTFFFFFFMVGRKQGKGRWGTEWGRRRGESLKRQSPGEETGDQCRAL